MEARGDEGGAMRFFCVERFPLVVATAPSGEHAADDVVDFYREWDAVIARGAHVVLVDLRHVNPSLIGAKERQAVADEAAQRRDGFQRTLRAEARLCTGPLVRATMAVVDWLIGSPSFHPIRNFDDRAAAERWLLGELGEERRI